MTTEFVTARRLFALEVARAAVVACIPPLILTTVTYYVWVGAKNGLMIGILGLLITGGVGFGNYWRINRHAKPFLASEFKSELLLTCCLMGGIMLIRDLSKGVEWPTPVGSLLLPLWAILYALSIRTVRSRVGAESPLRTREVAA